MCEWDELNSRYIKKVISEKDKELEKLHSIINKAIEYINENWYEEEGFMTPVIDAKELLSILQGDDKE